ncbi:MAG: hypothetical protein U1E53_01250 [Dongiaceae bacterium]
MSGKPGPVYLDLPGDVLFAEVTAARVHWPAPWDPARRRRRRRHGRDRGHRGASPGPRSR